MSHQVKAGETLSSIAGQYGISLTQLLAANPQYKADPDTLLVGATLLIPEQTAGQPLLEDDFRVEAGQLTFDAEGMEEEGLYFSRRPHVPGPTSGVTIGRGYDMKERSSHDVIEDLHAAGIELEIATKLARCRGLAGAEAKSFLEREQYNDITITPRQQKNLFNQVYRELTDDVIRICNKADVVAKYGQTEWELLNPLMRDVVVDLRYRGDYTGATRLRVQPLLVDSALPGLRRLMADRRYWVDINNVPNDRFMRRRDYLINA